MHSPFFLFVTSCVWRRRPLSVAGTTSSVAPPAAAVCWAASLVLLLAPAVFFPGRSSVRAQHFRAGTIEYRMRESAPDMLEITVTTSWRAGYPGSVSVSSEDLDETDGIEPPGFTTDENDLAAVVGYGSDGFGNRYVTLRHIAVIPKPFVGLEIFVSGCCFPAGAFPLDGAGGFGLEADPGGGSQFVSFATRFTPGVRASVVARAPAVVLVGTAPGPDDYAFAFVPAFSPVGSAIECSIDTSTLMPPGELIIFTDSNLGGCMVGWNNSQYGLNTTATVALRVAEPYTGHYISVTFLLMIADTFEAPTLEPIITLRGTLPPDGLPQHGGVLYITAGEPVEVRYTLMPANPGAMLTAASTSLPEGATITSESDTPQTFVLRWTPTYGTTYGTSSAAVPDPYSPTPAPTANSPTISSSPDTGLVLLTFTDTAFRATSASFVFIVQPPPPQLPSPPPVPPPGPPTAPASGTSSSQNQMSPPGSRSAAATPPRASVPPPQSSTDATGARQKLLFLLLLLAAVPVAVAIIAGVYYLRRQHDHSVIPSAPSSVSSGAIPSPYAPHQIVYRWSRRWPSRWSAPWLAARSPFQYAVGTATATTIVATTVGDPPAVTGSITTAAAAGAADSGGGGGGGPLRPPPSVPVFAGGPPSGGSYTASSSAHLSPLVSINPQDLRGQSSLNPAGQLPPPPPVAAGGTAAAASAAVAAASGGASQQLQPQRQQQEWQLQQQEQQGSAGGSAANQQQGLPGSPSLRKLESV